MFWGVVNRITWYKFPLPFVALTSMIKHIFYRKLLFCGPKTEIAYVIVGMVFQINPIDLFIYSFLVTQEKWKEHCQVGFAIAAQKTELCLLQLCQLNWQREFIHLRVSFSKSEMKEIHWDFPFYFWMFSWANSIDFSCYIHILISNHFFLVLETPDQWNIKILQYSI